MPREFVPYNVVTVTFPEAPLPTTALIIVSETTLNESAAVAPKLTAEVEVKCDPFITTRVVLSPEVGVKELIRGG